MTLVDAVSLTPESQRRRTARLLRVGAILLAALGSLPLFLDINALFAFALVGGPIVPLFCLYLAIAVAGGRKSLVVYLRRFGRTRSGQAVTTALESGVSRRHRIVTLDDSRFPPLEVPPWERRLSRYGPALLAVTLLALFVVTVRVLRQQGDYLWLWLSQSMIPLLVASLWSVLTTFLLLVIHRYRIRRLARGRIASQADLDACASRLAGLSAWWRAPAIAAPQATVLSVDDRMWQRTVEEIVGDGSAVLIDVSEPTSNLVWEIETVLRDAPTRTVFVGDRAVVTRWSEDAAKAADSESARRIQMLLQGRPILTYDVADRKGRRSFRRSLMRALDNVALVRRARPSASPAIGRWRRVASALSVVGLYLLAPVLATALSHLVIKAVPLERVLAGLLREHHPLDDLGSPEAELRRRGEPLTPDAIARAAQEGKPELVEELIRAGVSQAPVTAARWTPLLLAANSGSAETLKTLIAAAAPVDVLTDDGRSAVMLAAAGGHLAAAQVLVDAGATVNTIAARRTALGLAIQGGHADLVRLLLERGANVSTPHLGMSPLVLAAAVGRADMVEELLARGADVDARSETGRTPLGLATIAGCHDCIRALLSKGAGVDEVDGFGHTASSYATFNAHAGATALLAGAGARFAPPSDRSQADKRPGWDRSRPHVNLAVLSAIDSQAPAIVSAISRQFGLLRPRAGFLPAEQLEALRQNRFDGLPPRGLDARGIHIEFSTRERHYGLCLPASDADFRKISLLGNCLPDVIVIVTSPDGSIATFEEEVTMAREVGAPNVVVAIDVGRPNAGEQRLDENKATMREILARYEYGNVPVITLSSWIELSAGEEGEATIDTLMSALDNMAPPQRDRDAPLLMVVQGVTPRAGTTDIVHVYIETGTVRIGDVVEIVGLGSTRTATVVGIETFRKLLDRAEAHDRVGLLLQGVEDVEIDRGQVIARPGSIEAHTQFDAAVYMFSPAEGGRLSPVANGYRAFLYLRTAAATAVFDFPGNVPTLDPGGAAPARVKLLTPVAMAPGTRFTVQEGARTVGIGVVTRAF